MCYKFKSSNYYGIDTIYSLGWAYSSNISHSTFLITLQVRKVMHKASYHSPQVTGTNKHTNLRSCNAKSCVCNSSSICPLIYLIMYDVVKFNRL